ncbi:hypothetical protein HID58_037918 [Brassica napus]|uniref:Uncharacterized protein n=1 Tax=Brassica napus TaxID=3708 RepID=A0ABQ8BMP6_BRANA|nr:hypothetical protein HID58_037918 [Brassica napus]
MVAVDEQGEPAEAAQTIAELQKQIDGLQGQINDMHRARETTGGNPDLSSEVQSLKEKLDEHSKQLEQSAEKLSKLQSANTVLRDQNQTLKTAGNKKRCGPRIIPRTRGILREPMSIAPHGLPRSPSKLHMLARPGDILRGYIGWTRSKGCLTDAGGRHLARQETSKPGCSDG